MSSSPIHGPARRSPGRSTPDSRGATPVMVVYVAVVAIGIVVAGVLLFKGIVVHNARAAGAEDVRIPMLRNAVKVSPEDREIRRELAAAYQQVGRSSDALREYDTVLSIDALDADALFSAGMIHLQMDEERKAEDLFTRVLAVDRSHIGAAVALARQHARDGRFEDVLSVALKLSDAHPEIADLQYLVGLGYANTGKSSEAEKRYRRALKLVPEMEEARAALSNLEEGK